MTEQPIRNRAEWISLGISLTLLTGVMATVISLWLNPSRKPAEFTVERGEVRAANNHYYLPVTVKNEGDATAAQVTVEGTLDAAKEDAAKEDAAKEVAAKEVAATTFDFVPAHSNSEGVLIFSQEPTDATIRVISYQEP
jgi:uncharacterized protein (TIGR02588 family)